MSTLTRQCKVGCAVWEAFGTSVVLRTTDSTVLSQAECVVRDELDRIDLACSRFRDDSELSKLNASGGRPVKVGALLLEALELSLRAAELTEGDVDPTVGRALEIAGYDRDWQLLAPPSEDVPSELPDRAQPNPTIATVIARTLRGWRSVQLDHASSTVRVRRGIRIDLGATAKAWAADRAARRAASAAGCGVLVSIGGDIAVHGETPPHGWRVHVTDDHRSAPTAPGQTIALRSGGLATSSIAVRRWRHGGHDMHHVIDPRTGAPARARWRTASVAAPSCAEANIAATAALIKDERAATWLSELALPALLVDRTGEELRLCGWPLRQELRS